MNAERAGGGGWNVLKVLVFLPVAGAAVLALLPARRALPLWQVAMTFTVAALGYALWLAGQFDPAGTAVQMFESRAWNVRLGSYFALGVDGVSLAMVLLTALLSLIAVLVSRRMEAGARLYFLLVLLLESAMFGVFTARDWSLFYVFWEATLLPLFFMIDRLGGPNRQRAALNFFYIRWAVRCSCWSPCFFSTMRRPATASPWPTWPRAAAACRCRRNC